MEALVNIGLLSRAVTPFRQHPTVSLPRYGTRAAHRSPPCAGAASQEGIFLEEDGQYEVPIDSGIFEEVFPTVRKLETSPKSGKQGKLGDSMPKSILIPDEWVSVQKHHLRTKKERKQETLALQIQRARDKEAELRAVKEKAAREKRARLYRSLYPNSAISTCENDGSNASASPAADGESNDVGRADLDEEDILEELFEESGEETISGRARPKDYRAGLEFSSLEEVTEKLREVVESSSGGRRSHGGESGDETDEEEPQIAVELTPEEKEMLRSRNMNFAKISSTSWSPLHTLASAGQVYLAAELIKRGAQVDTLDKEGLTPMHRAIQGGRKTMVRLLLKAGASVHVRDKDGATLLHYAAQSGNRDITRLLLRDDVDLNAADKDGWTPLHVAVQTGRTEFYDTIKFMKRREAAEARRRRTARESELLPHDEAA
ncbi:hypothetical protein R1sor_015625 [Riccia sorocarpa]|uniref:Uncharacterized protein n=1 Tax=Riccia sorocarpa TaxID=122646 RepID=A0ABD3HEQ6_9MARC